MRKNRREKLAAAREFGATDGVLASESKEVEKQNVSDFQSDAQAGGGPVKTQIRRMP